MGNELMKEEQPICEDANYKLAREKRLSDFRAYLREIAPNTMRSLDERKERERILEETKNQNIIEKKNN